MYLKNLSKIELSMGNRQYFSQINMDLFLLQSGNVFNPVKEKCSFIELNSYSHVNMRYIFDNYSIDLHDNPCDKMFFVRLKRKSPKHAGPLYIKNIFFLSIIMTGYIGNGSWTIPF